MHRQPYGNRKIAFCLCVFLLFSLLPVSSQALTSAPLSGGETQNGMVRVYLSSLGNPSTLNLTVNGSYSVNGISANALSNGAKLTLKFNSVSGSLLLTYNGATTNMGTGFTLRRHESSQESGIKIAQGRVPSNLYPADFSFVVKKNGNTYKLYVIASVFMEDYLYGVLPYEMGNTSGLEALKAQAVAARTYTMRAMSAASGNIYDLVDTTADQVYSGTPSGNQNCRAAVDATRGIVAMNGTAFTATYYTASNGGQTESIQNAWGTGSSFSYLKVKDDPYDLQNPDSRKVSFFVRSSGTQSSTTLQNLLNKKAAAAYGSGASVTGVMAVTPRTPKYASPSRLYTKMDFSILYMLNGQEKQGKITFDIFSELEGPLGMSINAGSNELWSVENTSGGFTVTARRYGHGLGMSQRGAMYMAKLGYTYDQILAFYFEGCKRVQYSLARSILSPIVSGQDTREHLTVETPAPIPEETDEISAAVKARVTTPSGTLNLRSFASSNAAVMLTIPQNALIPILEKGSEWCKTNYNGKTGYVMTSFLTFTESETVAPAASPAPLPETNQEEAACTARVTTPSGSLNLRSSASDTARVLCTIPQNAVITLNQIGDTWCKTVYNGQSGYVMTKFLTLSNGQEISGASAPSAPEAPVASGTVTARVATVSGSLNLRYSAADTARVLCTIPQYTLISVSEKGKSWSKATYNGQTGYVMTKFLSFDDASSTPSKPAEESTEVNDGKAWVATESGSLNLRRKANNNADVLATIPQYAEIRVVSKGSNWCQVQYQELSGYVMTKFLSFTPVSQPQAPNDSGASVQTTQISEDDRLIAQITTPGGSLNLRKKANDQAVVLCTIPQDELVLVLQQGSNWCQVTYEGKTGYVMTKFLTLQKPTQEDTSGDASTVLSARVSDAASTLNLRSSGSMMAPILLEIPRGSMVTVLQAGNEWCQVVYEGKTGYCAREYLEFENE